jgi:hypothetical protein
MAFRFHAIRFFFFYTGKFVAWSLRISTSQSSGHGKENAGATYEILSEGLIEAAFSRRIEPHD